MHADAREQVVRAIEQGCTTRRTISKAVHLNEKQTHQILVSLALEDRVALSAGHWRVLRYER